MCKGLNAGLYFLGKIHKYLDRSSTEKLVYGTITSKLDYCSSLLYGMKVSDANCLQHVQNYTARIVLLTSKYVHITPVLQHLHWLPLQQRVEYKVLLMTYKVLNNQAPEYSHQPRAPLYTI